MEIQYTRISMTPSGVPPVFYMSQYDIGRPVGFICDADLSGYTVTLEATRTDGTPVLVGVTVNGNIGTFATTATMTNKEDDYPAQVVISADGERIASIHIRIHVVKAAMDENSEAIEEDASLFQQYTESISAVVAEISDTVTDLTASSIKIFRTVAEMQAGFTAEDGVCMVVDSEILYTESDSFKPGRPNLYRYVADGVSYEYPLSGGGYAELIIPAFKPPKGGVSGRDALPAILTTAYSYCGVTKPGGFVLEGGTVVPNIQYQHTSGPYASSAAGHQGIQCSQFVHAILRGLTYEASKLADEDNANASEYGAATDFFFDGIDHPAISAHMMAHILAAKGQLKATARFEEAEVGDILFFGSSENAATMWRGIGHCAVCVGKLSNGIMWVQAGSTPSIAGFGRSRNRPGYESDAVNFDFATPINVDFSDGTYSLIGIGRVAYGFPAKVPGETKTGLQAGVPELTGTYTAGQSNISFNLLQASAEKSYRFGVTSWGGYTGRKDSGVGIRIYRITDGSDFPATGYEITTSSRLVAGGIMPVLFNCDGRSKVCSAAIIIGTTSATQSDTYMIRDLTTDFYK